MPTPILTAHDAAGHVHLIVGSNSLASARCNRSVEAGAKAVVVAPPDAEIHYALQKKIEDGQVEWIKGQFEDQILQTCGRAEVDNVVDAVFVTLGGKNLLSTHSNCLASLDLSAETLNRYTYLHVMPSASYPGQCR